MVEEMLFCCLLVKGVDSVVMSIPLSTCWMSILYAKLILIFILPTLKTHFWRLKGAGRFLKKQPRNRQTHQPKNPHLWRLKRAGGRLKEAKFLV